jgi:hypothetical protein
VARPRTPVAPVTNTVAIDISYSIAEIENVNAFDRR